MGRMICAKCGEILKCKKNGVTVKYGLYSGYFRADLYECPLCRMQIITGLSGEIFGDEKVDYDFTGENV